MIYGTVRNLCPPKNLLSSVACKQACLSFKAMCRLGIVSGASANLPCLPWQVPTVRYPADDCSPVGLILLSLAAGTRLTSWLAGVFAVCRRFYLLYQHHTTLETVYKDNDMFGTNNAFSFLRMMVTASLPHRRFFKLPRAL